MSSTVPLQTGAPAFKLIDLSDFSEVGVYGTLTQARRESREFPRFEILGGRWDGESDLDGSILIERCDPYEGDDDRAKQGLGLPNASEAG